VEVAKGLGIDVASLPEHHIDTAHPAVQAMAKHLAAVVDEMLG
jgi:hypothetical protein